VAIGALGIGGVFGSYEVSVVAFTREAGSPGASGIVLGLWALGSMIGGIVFGALHWRLPLPRQVLVLAAALAVILIPAPFVSSITTLSIATFVAGAAVAPALIANFSLTERLVPSALLTEGLTWTNSGLAFGFSAGTAIGGAVVDAAGTTYGFVLPIVSASLAAVVAMLGQRVLLRSARAHAPTELAPTWNTDPVPGPTPGGILDDPGAS
jgi:predicted MFS family arabinose efflux permease